MKTMNGRQAIEAMLQGKVVGTDAMRWRFTTTFERQVYNHGWYAHPFPPANLFELYQEPNPHEPGTYAWAREEHARGHAVTNSEKTPRGPATYQPWMAWETCMMFTAEFETKTWRRA